MKLSNRNIIIGIGIIIVLGIAYLLSDIVAYILIAWILSLLGAPFMRFYGKILKIGKYQAGKSFRAILTILTFGLFIFLFSRMVIPPVIQQAQNLAGVDYNKVIKSLEEPANDLSKWLGKHGIKVDFLEQKDTIATVPKTEQKDLIRSEVAIEPVITPRGDTLAQTNIKLDIHIEQEKPIQTVEKPLSSLENLQKKVLTFLNPSRLPNLFGSLISFASDLLIGILSVLFITFFFLKDQGLFVNFVKTIVPKGTENQSGAALENITKLLSRYFGGIAIQMSIITIFISTVLTILGVKNALLIGFFAAFINIIPFLGPLIGAAFGAIIVISSNLDAPFYTETLPLLFKVLGTFAAMQMLDNFVLQPVIFSKSVQAHPLEIFIIILVGGKIGGVVGMILAIPTYTIFRVIAKEFWSGYKIVQRITKNMGEDV